MKKFTAVVESIREINEKELSELQKSYREYFGAKMEKFGVKSPAELDDDQKKEFFNEITKDWEKGQGASEAGKKDVEEHGVKESLNEGSQEEQIKKECITKLSDFFGCSPGNLSKFKFDGNDNIKELTKALRSTSDEGTAQYYRIVIIMAKRDLGIHESEEVNISGDVNEGVYSKTSKKFNLDIAKKKTGQILDVIRSGSGIGFCQINTEGDKAFLIIKADKDDQYDIEKILSESEVIDEAIVNEKDIKSKDDFKAFAEDKLKKQHGDDFDQDKADKVIKGLSDEAGESGDWGAAVGKLNKA